MTEDQFIEKIQAMSNADLLDEYKTLAGGDAPNGMLTEIGHRQFDQVQRELEYRLQEIGFLPKIQKDPEIYKK